MAILATGASVAFLLSFNVRNLGIYFAVGFLCGYAAHELCRGLWLLRQHPIDRGDLLSDGIKHVAPRVPGETEFDRWLNDQAPEIVNQSANQSHNLLGFMIVLGVLGLSFIVLYDIYHAPWYFAKLLVDSGKVRHRVTSADARLGLLFLPVRQTWAIALVL
jgi:hypothetical protein